MILLVYRVRRAFFLAREAWRLYTTHRTRAKRAPPPAPPHLSHAPPSARRRPAECRQCPAGPRRAATRRLVGYTLFTGSIGQRPHAEAGVDQSCGGGGGGSEWHSWPFTSGPLCSGAPLPNATASQASARPWRRGLRTETRAPAAGAPPHTPAT
jgi:hypothetical protein